LHLEMWQSSVGFHPWGQDIGLSQPIA
jgi:hypothetical protein